MRDEKMGAGKAFKPGAAGTLPPVPAPFLSPLDHGAIGIVWGLWNAGVNVLPIIRTDSLEALDALQAFDGLFDWLAPNRSRVRAWMPRLERVALDVSEAGLS